MKILFDHETPAPLRRHLYVSRKYLTNSSVRQRFGIETRNSARASRLIAEALKAGAIVPDDPAAAPKLMRYVPAWAKAEDHAVT